ncbi:MAG: serine/threonine-protein kinase [Sandaracinaceae bacterium]
MPVYEPVCPIARGGMATVDLVVRREGSFLRPYAMKRFLPGATADAKRMFLDEARIAGLLRHPNVVSVLDVGEDREGPYLLMDYVEGVSLYELIRAYVRASSDPIPVQICLRILVQAARGLAAAHELRDPSGEHLELVHRDISPQNLLLDLSGTVRVADFGIARATGRATETENGILKGKLGYLAPETLRFESVDHRADLFSLGVVAFELFAGKRLYGGGDVNTTAQRILFEAPPDVGMLQPDAPDGAVELLFRLLAKEPAHRPESARDVADTLDALLVERVTMEGAQPLDAFLAAHVDATEIEARRERIAAAQQRPPSSTPAAAEATVQSRWRTPALAGAFVLALVGAGGVTLWGLTTPAAPEEEVPIAAPAAAVDPAPEPPPATPEPAVSEAPAAPEVEATEPEPEPRPARRRRRTPRRQPTKVPVVHAY